LNPPEPKCKYGKKIVFAVQQRIVAEYLDPQSPYRGLLCYHGLGSGKTLLIAAVICKYIQKDPTRTILVLLKPSLVQNFYDELNKVDAMALFGEALEPKVLERRLRESVNAVTFEAFSNRLNGKTRWDLGINKFISQKNRKGIKTETKGRGLGALPDGTVCADSEEEPMMNNTIVLIDEAHNLVTPKDAGYPKNPDDAYSVLNAIRNAKDCKTVLLTATPMRNEPYEIGVLVNMLKHKDSKTRFPEVYTANSPKTMTQAKVNILDPMETKKAFNAMFYNTDETTGIREIKNEDVFIKNCKGLISFFPVDNIFTMFAKKNLMRINVPLSDKTFAASRKKWVEDFKGLQKNSHISCVQADKLCAASRDKNNIFPVDVGRLSHGSVGDFAASSKENAPKLHAIADTLEDKYIVGKQFVYTYFDYAISALSAVLKKRGWTELTAESLKVYLKKQYRATSNVNRPDFEKRFKLDVGTSTQANENEEAKECVREKELELGKKCFVTLGRDTTDKWKEKLVKLFYNLTENTKGDRINLCIGNRKYSEGISLMSIRSIHVIEPATSEGLMDQVVGRGVRNCSHNNKILKFPDDWVVNVYSYYATHPSTAQFEIPETKGQITKVLNPTTENAPTTTENTPTTTENAPTTDDNVVTKNADTTVVLPVGGGRRSSPNRRINRNWRRTSARAHYKGGAETRRKRAAPKKTEDADGQPTKRTRKASKDDGDISKDAVTTWCATHPQDKCDQYDACTWQNNACVSLGIDDMVKKMAVNQSRLNDRFLELLQLSAVDCNTFKQLHDNPSRTCFVTSESDSTIDRQYEDAIRQYKGFNQSDKLETDSGVSSTVVSDKDVSDVKGDQCTSLTDIQCNIAPHCYKSGSKCEPKTEEVGTNHGKCNVYYTNSQQCAIDPMCQWGLSADEKMSCQPRYLVDLKPNTIALEDSKYTSDSAQEYKLYPLYVSDKKNIEKELAEDIVERFATRETTPNSAPELVEILGQIVLHLQHGRETYCKTALSTSPLKAAFMKDYERHASDWTSIETRAKLAHIAAILSHHKPTDTSETFSTRAFDYSKNELIDMWNKRKRRYMHYSFCVSVDNALYYFHSRERTDAPIFLSGMSRLTKIVKYIQIHDINVQCSFYIPWNSIERVELKCHKWNPNMRAQLNRSLKVEKLSKADVFAPAVDTILIREDYGIVQLFDNARCGELWEKVGASFPQEYNCGDKTPRVVVSTENLQQCKQSQKTGGLRNRVRDMTRSQANKCYYDWLEHPEKRPPSWHRYTKKKHDAVEKLLKSSKRHKLCTNRSTNPSTLNGCDQKLYRADNKLTWGESPVTCNKWFQCDLKPAKTYVHKNYEPEEEPTKNTKKHTKE
jgi:superfamily II DNA or RNA helicase